MGERITRGKAIRLKCLDCCCGSALEVRLCEIRRCPLWRYRLGKEDKNCEDAQGFPKKDSGKVPIPPQDGLPGKHADTRAFFAQTAP